MKVLFLDLDGVANSQRYLTLVASESPTGTYDEHPDKARQLDPVAIERLRVTYT